MIPETKIGSLDRSRWTVVGLKDERTGRLSYLITFPVGDGTIGSLELGNDLSYHQMAQRLKGHTTLLPKAGAAQLIEELVLGAAARFVIKAQSPGWKKTRARGLEGSVSEFAAFVTPGRIFGPEGTEYRWASPPGHRPHIGQAMGTVEGWCASVGSLAEKSNYIAFAMMLALAGPLLAFADLSEDPAFNFFGETSVGKTTAAKVGASVVGHPDAMGSWDMSERGLEEAAAACTDLMLVLNAAERAAPKRRRELLNRIIHMVAERSSTARSDAVQDRLPNLTWRTVLLSTSNMAGVQMATDAGLSWDLQEAVRFVDIPIPPADEGGIFDRLGAIPNKAARSTALIRDLEKALQRHYGVLLCPWIEYLLAMDARKRVTQLMARFDRKTGPYSGLDDRIARKFGVVYAAGKIAVEAGLLKWPSGLPLAATKTLLDRARHQRGQGDRALEAALAKLVEVLDDPRFVLPAVDGSIKVAAGQPFLGVRYVAKGKTVIGLRREGLSELVGPDLVAPVVQALAELGAVETGHGGKSTRQLPLRLSVGGMDRSKLRFLVVKPDRLTNHAMTTRQQTSQIRGR